jgi:hypothetical protein
MATLIRPILRGRKSASAAAPTRKEITIRIRPGSGSDYRPGYGYTEHVLCSLARADSDVQYPTEIDYVGGDKWDIYGGNDDAYIDQSVDQSGDLNRGLAGTEYTSYAGADMRDQGQQQLLEREGTNGIWYFWGAATQDPETGYIAGSYDESTGPDSPLESWSWNCS